MLTNDNRQPQFTSPDLSGFAVEDVILKSGVFKLSNPRMRETVYLKYTGEYEIDMTSRAAQFPLSPQSNIVLPEIIDPAQLKTLNAETQRRIAREEEDIWYRIGHDKKHALITRALPNRAPLRWAAWQDASDLMKELRSVPISRTEWRQFYRDLCAWNKAGVFHNDLLGNTFPTRDEAGKLSFNIIDFSKSDRSNSDDRESILWFGMMNSADGPIDARAMEWSCSQFSRSRDEHNAQFVIGIHRKIAAKGITGDIRHSSLQTIMQHIPRLPRVEQAEAYRFVQGHTPEGSRLWKMSAEALRKPWFGHFRRAIETPSAPQGMKLEPVLAACTA